MFLVNYATPQFFESQARLNASALRHGVDQIFAFRPEQLAQTAFFDEHRSILEQPRGAGYFLWKPYFILEAFDRLCEGDVLLYLDSGIEIVDSLEPLARLCRKQDGILLFACHGHHNATWTKRDCFVRLNCDEPRFHAAEQVSAGFLVLEKNRRSEEFVRDWLHSCTLPGVLDDSPNSCGLPNHDDFREHRHDQSVLSLLAEREGIPRFRDPSQWGNPLKLPEFRMPSEFLPEPYAAVPDARSRYGAVLDLHRLGARRSDEVITVLVGNHNGWPELEDTLRSVATQTSRRWRCLILDDGSDDGSADALRIHPLIADDPRFRLITRETPCGAALALAELVAQAETSLVGVLNAGDALHPECVERVLRAYGETEREFVYTNFFWCDGALQPQQLGFCRALSPGQTTLERGCISHFKTFRKSAFERTPGLDLSLEWAVDADLIYQLEEVAEPYFLDEPLYLHRAPGNREISRAERAQRASAEDAHAKRQALARRARTPQRFASVELPCAELSDLIPAMAGPILWIQCGSADVGAVSPPPVGNLKITYLNYDPATKESPEALLSRGAALSGLSSAAAPGVECIVCDGFDRLRDPEDFLDVVYRALAARGTFITRIANVRHERVLAALLRGTWAGDADDPHRVRYRTRREAEKLFSRHGFELIQMQSRGNASASDEGEEGSGAVVHLSALVAGADPALAQELRTERYVICARAVPTPEHGLTSIIILTHNQLAFTRRCLDSLRLRTDEPYELICVDNASTDGTVEYLRTLEGVQVIANAENKGFPAGMNQGIRAAQGDQILLLNNDTILTTGWLGRMLAALHSAPDVGIVGPASNSVSGVQQVPVSYSREHEIDGFAWDWGKAHHRRWHDVERLVGFCFLFRRELVEKLGLLDERFGIGCYEDDDYSRRAIAVGYRLLFAEDSFVHHYGSQTFRASGVDFAKVLRDNGEIYAAKWNGSDPVSRAPIAPCPPAAACRSDLALTRAPSGGLLLVNRRPRLSLCMIVRDNERTIEPCLASIQPWVDEIIVVDTGSLDRTPEIARRYGARLFEFPWCDNFAAARNQSLQHARGEWIFWMDSDDTISPECGRQLRELTDREHAPEIFGYILQVHCPGEDRAHDLTVVDHVKLFRNRPDLRFEGRIHEQIIPAIRRAGGDVAWTDIHVVHSGSEHSPESRARKLERDFRILELELRDQPDHPFVLFNLGMTHADAEQYEQAIHFLRRCLEVAKPEESHVRKAYALLVSAYSQAQQHEAGWDICRSGLDLFPEDKELLFRSALLHHHFGRLEEAEHAYLRVLHDAEERHFTSVDQGLASFKARHNLALVYEDQGDLKKAEEQWRCVVAERPAYGPGWQGLGRALLALGDCDATERIACDLKLQALLRCEGLQLAALCAEKRGDLLTACGELQTAIRAFPNELQPLRELCRLFFHHATPENAEAVLRQLAARDGNDPSVHHNLGTLYFRMNQFEEALACTQRSLALRPHSAATHRQLQQILRHQNPSAHFA